MLGDAAAHGGHRLDRLAGERCRPLRPRRCGAGAGGAAGAAGAGAAAGFGATGASAAARCRRRGAGLDEIEDVLLRHAAAAAGALHLAGVDAVLGGDPRHHRGDERLAVLGRLLHRNGARAGAAATGSGATGSGAGAGCGRPARAAAGSGGAAAAAAPADPRERRADLDRLALLDEDLRQRARCGARHLGVDLVGRDLEQRLVRLDVLALLLQPAGDRPLGDGHAHLRHHDVDCGLGGHATPSNTPRAREVPRRRRRPAG